MADTVIYGALGSPYAARVVLAAWLKQLDFSLQLPRSGLRSEDYLALNPMGKIPLLVDDLVTLPESDVICQYLEDRYPEPPLLPAAPAERNRVRLVSRIVDEYLLPSVTELIRAAREPAPDAQRISERREEAARSAGHVAHFMGHGPYAWAEQPTLADCALAPALFFIGAVLESVDGMSIVRANPRMGQWWRFFQAQPIGERFIRESSEAFAAFRRRRQSGRHTPDMDT